MQGMRFKHATDASHSWPSHMSIKHNDILWEEHSLWPIHVQYQISMAVLVLKVLPWLVKRWGGQDVFSLMVKVWKKYLLCIPFDFSCIYKEDKSFDYSSKMKDPKTSKQISWCPSSSSSPQFKGPVLYKLAFSHQCDSSFFKLSGWELRKKRFKMLFSQFIMWKI